MDTITRKWRFRAEAMCDFENLLNVDFRGTPLKCHVHEFCFTANEMHLEYDCHIVLDADVDKKTILWFMSKVVDGHVMERSLQEVVELEPELKA